MKILFAIFLSILSFITCGLNYATFPSHIINHEHLEKNTNEMEQVNNCFILIFLVIQFIR